MIGRDPGINPEVYLAPSICNTIDLRLNLVVNRTQNPCLDSLMASWKPGRNTMIQVSK